MSRSNQRIFGALVDKPRTTGKWLFLPLSLFIHGVVIAGFVLLPLLSADAELLPIKVANVMLTDPAPPAVPPPPPAAKGGGKKARKKAEKKAEKPQPVNTGRFVAPMDIPSEIVEEELGVLGGLDGGIPGGVDGGLVGGVPGGVLGAPLLDGKQDFDRELRLDTFRKPRLMKEVTPIYPPLALKAHVQGNVIVEATTDIFGKVVKIRVITGNSLLTKAAVEAVRQWVYEPYTINGNPRPVIFTVTVIFTLQR